MTLIEQNIASLDAAYEKALLSGKEEDRKALYEWYIHHHHALRQAILDGERYKAAGDALAKAMKEYAVEGCMCKGFGVHCVHTLLSKYIAAYRTAIEDSSK